MKYCKSCGSAISDDAGFCENCGAKVEGEASAVVSNQVSTVAAHGIKERNLVVAIILTIVTCGLYGLYWQVKINDEALSLSGEKGPSGIVVILLTIITCGIYGLFWAYKMGVCTDKIKGVQNGMSGVLYLVLVLFGLSIVDMALTQDAINSKVRG